MNVPIAINGMVISLGDLVWGNAVGFLSVPLDAVEQVYLAASQQHDAENKQMDNIKIGKNERAWVVASLIRIGCKIEQ